ncbi:DUF1365 domain-containing protein [Usitatibacter palustris]|uniref:DUF1365 domain-containing protein n=1 Tax=Usitatibacter palustris TaxID=2732487 RepID=A0A6M4H349_9PROT|nr:DUF1365 domain-containing protein [Usitatibacter palustris]QJR13732.1 hypothetical protein DSM104440_00522 [Usitatibacter palustris]
MHSAIYSGWVRHRRYAPRPHAFRYPLSLMYLDLAELDDVFRGRWLWSTRRPAIAWMRRADYLGEPGLSLDEAVRRRVDLATGERPRGPIRLLTQLRVMGLAFNPVSFYYCYDEAGTRVESIVTEITNTPWNERHAYVLPVRAGASEGRSMRFRFGKRFHVSPFMPMEIDYDWRLSPPGARLAVHMVNLRKGERIFDATLSLERREIGGASLAATLARQPIAAAQVVGAIYWQALRLWAKGVPVHTHPDKELTTP